MDYVETGRDFIRAARTGNWDLHVASISRMLNLFSVAGHLNYTKSTRIYLQLMLDLLNSHPWLHEKFLQSLFVVRRSNRYSAGL